MNSLTYEQVLAIHEALLQADGGATGIRDDNALRSAVEQPRMSAFGADLYPELHDKAAALGFSLIQNHSFVDGNKRVGHAAAVIFLKLNGFRIDAPVDEQEAIILQVASGMMERAAFAVWLREHLVPVAD